MSAGQDSREARVALLEDARRRRARRGARVFTVELESGIWDDTHNLSFGLADSLADEAAERPRAEEPTGPPDDAHKAVPAPDDVVDAPRRDRRRRLLVGVGVLAAVVAVAVAMPVIGVGTGPGHPPPVSKRVVESDAIEPLHPVISHPAVATPLAHRGVRTKPSRSARRHVNRRPRNVSGQARPASSTPVQRQTVASRAQVTTSSAPVQASPTASSGATASSGGSSSSTSPQPATSGASGGSTSQNSSSTEQSAFGSAGGLGPGSSPDS